MVQGMEKTQYLVPHLNISCRHWRNCPLVCSRTLDGYRQADTSSEY